jgi:hypothetical protein
MMTAEMAAGFVLDRVCRCGVAQGYASLTPLPAALPDDHFVQSYGQERASFSLGDG